MDPFKFTLEDLAAINRHPLAKIYYERAKEAHSDLTAALTNITMILYLAAEQEDEADDWTVVHIAGPLLSR